MSGRAMSGGVFVIATEDLSKFLNMDYFMVIVFMEKRLFSTKQLGFKLIPKTKIEPTEKASLEIIKRQPDIRPPVNFILAYTSKGIFFKGSPAELKKRMDDLWITQNG